VPDGPDPSLQLAPAAVVAGATPLLRQLPNALSVARLAAAPVLVGLALAGEESVYTWLLLPALATDIADGVIARWFHLETVLGARLDSIADLLITIAALVGAWVFHPELFRDYWPGLALFLGAGLLEYVLAWLRYGRLSSFHTWLSKAAGVMLVLFVFALFLEGLIPWLFYLAIGLAVLSSLEEYALLALLPAWRSNVGGLWQVLRERNG
jgi:CDP-diacylglycerol--glycerol-3-phosphate 3-phosphatidyltransferase